jgi:hypothetical protein
MHLLVLASIATADHQNIQPSSIHPSPTLYSETDHGASAGGHDLLVLTRDTNVNKTIILSLK